MFFCRWYVIVKLRFQLIQSYLYPISPIKNFHTVICQLCLNLNWFKSCLQTTNAYCIEICQRMSSSFSFSNMLGLYSEYFLCVIFYILQVVADKQHANNIFDFPILGFVSVNKCGLKKAIFYVVNNLESYQVTDICITSSSKLLFGCLLDVMGI